MSKNSLFRGFQRIFLKDGKNSAKLIAEFALLPQNKPLTARIYANDFIKRLDEKIGLCVDTAYAKRGIFFLRAKSAVHYAELKHESVEIYLKESLEIYAKKRPLSEFDKVKAVKILPPRDAFARDKRFKNGLKGVPIEERPLIERSKGVFKNAFKDETLRAKFEALRGAVQKKNEALSGLV